MTEAEKTLLLTVGRILRAKIKNEVYAEQEDDLWAIHEALKPFDAEGGATLNTVYPAPEYNGGDTPPI